MLELKPDREYRGHDIYLNGDYVGWVSSGDFRESPKDRKPVTMLRAENGTRYHENWKVALQYICEFYNSEFI